MKHIWEVKSRPSQETLGASKQRDDTLPVVSMFLSVGDALQRLPDSATAQEISNASSRTPHGFPMSCSSDVQLIAKKLICFKRAGNMADSTESSPFCQLFYN